MNLTQLARKGFTVVEGLAETDLLRVVQPLGHIRVDRRSPELIRDIKPQPLNVAKPNTLSSRYGMGKFPFHTDSAHWERPANYLLLYCVSPGQGMRPTFLQDSWAWRLNNDQTNLACRALWAVGHRRVWLSHVAERTGDRISFRFDMDCMRPMTAEARELNSILDDKIRTTDQLRIDWQIGNLLVIDNSRMLHARGAANRPDSDRVLKRILVGGG